METGTGTEGTQEAQDGLAILVPLVLLVFLFPVSSFGQDKIQAYVSQGKLVYTNLVDNTPQPPAPILAQTTDGLASEVPPSLRSLVDTIATNHGVDPALVRAVIKTESNFNRFAVSNKGALGLMQLIPDTGRRYGVRDFFDPEQNVDGGVRYLRFLLEKFNGNLDLSLAAYNAGENLVERLGRIPPIPETTSYVRRVRSNYKQKSAPLLTPAVSTVAAKTAKEPVPPPIFKVVDERGVVHFSNVDPNSTSN
jgi:soluble lytic murein transglycosylase-like protein